MPTKKSPANSCYRSTCKYLPGSPGRRKLLRRTDGLYIQLCSQLFSYRDLRFLRLFCDLVDISVFVFGCRLRLREGSTRETYLKRHSATHQGQRRSQIRAREPESYSKLVGARSRQYRRRCLQVHTHFAALSISSRFADFCTAPDSTFEECYCVLQHFS